VGAGFLFFLLRWTLFQASLFHCHLSAPVAVVSLIFVARLGTSHAVPALTPEG